jgi:mannose-6-phosphate isomerase-like protein (cupin superfamily)
MDFKILAKEIIDKSLEKKVVSFLKENPNPVDSALHAWAEKQGLDVHEVETQIYRLATDFVETLDKNSSKEPPINSKLKGFVTDIEDDTVKNTNFRKVLYTGKNSQLVLMSLKPKEDIGEEVHDVDQFFRIDEGSGKVIINGTEHKLSDGFAIVIPAGAKHNIVNTGTKDLKLYSIYSPPHHSDKIIHKTKKDALSDKEHFDGKTTE